MLIESASSSLQISPPNLHYECVYVCVCVCVCVCVHGKKDSKPHPLTTHLEKEHQIEWQNVLAREIMQQEALQNLSEREIFW